MVDDARIDGSHARYRELDDSWPYVCRAAFQPARLHSHGQVRDGQLMLRLPEVLNPLVEVSALDRVISKNNEEQRNPEPSCLRRDGGKLPAGLRADAGPCGICRRISSCIGNKADASQPTRKARAKATFSSSETALRALLGELRYISA